MSELTSLAGTPRTLRVRVDGEDREYLIHPLSIADWAAMQAWVDAQFPQPHEVTAAAIARGNYTVAQQQYLMRIATELACEHPGHPIGTPEADRLIQSLAGTKELLKIAIRKGRPEFTDAEAERLYLHLTLGQLEALYRDTEAALLMGDPKDGPTTSGGNGRTTSPRRRGRGSRGGSSTTTR